MEDVEKLQKEIELLKNRLKVYEENGAAKLYYSLQRKSWEMADLLNAVSLKNLDITSKSDASFERIFKLLEKSEGISNAVKGLGESAGITGDEKKDVEKKPFVDTIAEKRY